MAEIIEFPKQPDRSKLIDALLDIRLTLTIKKLVSDYIKKSEFKKYFLMKNMWFRTMVLAWP